jgi:hypothetical protein
MRSRSASKRTVSIVLVVFAFVSRGVAVNACPTRGDAADKFPFTLIGDHIYVDAIVNGTGPYRFIVDTGGVNLIDATLAKSLSLKLKGKESGRGVGAKKIEIDKTMIDRLILGDLTFRQQKFYTFDFKQLYSSGVEMEGMVDASLFHQYATCTDFDHQVIDLRNLL